MAFTQKHFAFHQVSAAVDNLLRASQSGDLEEIQRVLRKGVGKKDHALLHFE